MHHTIILDQQNNSKNVCNDCSLESLKGVEANICGVLFVIIPLYHVHVSRMCVNFLYDPRVLLAPSGRALCILFLRFFPTLWTGGLKCLFLKFKFSLFFGH